MWYVIQVLSGMERKTLEKIARVADKSTYVRCQIPRREQSRRKDGSWVVEEEILFPGYLFVKTKTPEAFVNELSKITETTKLLSGESESGERLFIPLTHDEVSFISALTGKMDGTVRMSTGIIEGDAVRVIRGPLQGYEGLIRKVDRHKRAAYLGVDMCGRTVNVKLGLEIVSKS